MGTRCVDYSNRFLIIGLIISFLAFWSLPAFPMSVLIICKKITGLPSLNILLIMFVCFGYQNLVPSITYYLQKNVQALRIAIVVGNMIPFFLYFLWNFIILSVIPASTLINPSENNMVSDLLQQAAGSPAILFYAKVFSFFVMITSFIAIAITFVDFLKDGFKTSFQRDKKLLIYALVFLPPMFVSFFCIRIFS